MFKTIKDFNLINKRILVRCDFNVPLDEKGEILDDFRIKQTLPTIQYLIDQNSRIILMSHLGEPDGKIVTELKLDKVAERLAECLNLPIGKEDECIGAEVEGQSNNLKPGKILLLENLRFHKEETELVGDVSDLDFAKKLSYLGDIYVNDAFGVCHRNNASVVGVPNFLPHCAGLLLETEVTSLDKIVKYPEKPLIAIVGGKKVETKAKFINNISKFADYVLVSGLIAKEIAEKSIKFDHPEKIIVPVGNLDAPDIDDESIKIFEEKISEAATIVWNGPFGKFEDKQCIKGTLAIANAIIKSKAFSVVGGGETVEFLNKQGIIDEFSHVSTGGGAMLSYLAGEKMPGLDAIEREL
jgi:phosphoglycerate kinase